MQFEFKNTDLSVSTDQFLVGTEKIFFIFFYSILQYAGFLVAVHKVLYSLILIFFFLFVSYVCVECIIK